MRRPAQALVDRGLWLLALAGVAFALAPSAHAQQKGAAAQVRGLNGTWERYPSLSSGLGSAKNDGPPAPAPIPPPPLKPEYLKPWQAKQAEIQKLTEQGLPPANNYSACIPDGMPAMMQAMFPMEFLETPGQVTVIEEAYNQVRRIYLDQALVPAEDAEPRFWGHSVGHWEGNTLVASTVGVKDNVLFRNVPHSMKMRIDERIQLVGQDFMRDDVTVTDPEYLTGPWTWTWMYRRWPGYQIQEYVCEDNRYSGNPENGSQRLRLNDQ